MPLSDSQIQRAIADRAIVVDPYDPDNVKPSSLDIRLGDKLALLKDAAPLDLGSDDDIDARYETISIHAEGYELHPGASVLGHAFEHINFGNHCGLVMTRSSVARLGLLCNISGYANPGYAGKLPLMIVNVGSAPIRLAAGRRIAQVLFFPVTEVNRMYADQGGKYMNESGPTPSKHHLDAELRGLLKRLGVPSKQLEKTLQYLDSKVDEAAAGVAAAAAKTLTTKLG